MSARKSIVACYTVSEIWRWVVIPANCPYVYVPFAVRSAAESAAAAFERDRPARLEDFVHFPVPEAMRAKLRLPVQPLPDLPPLPGYKDWRPTDKSSWDQYRSGAVNATAEVTIRVPGRLRTRRIFLVATPRAAITTPTA
ncbi:hypothetical protein [Nocardia wallacei]|uniref:Uncharacterized protein n=1 Tax=Nocardia wallacei TaxID=480035 RepID=A0A7G1KTV5_9NOCA|nr:hypothetical protein [Nocardia wallacei]BCK58361.1 hypothetical protein NWFMUON74_61330 [Nocardia wallacei]